MGNILQLKGKNFLGIPFFDKKVYPITKTEAVIGTDGKQLSQKIEEIDTKVDNSLASLYEVIEVSDPDIEVDQAAYNRYIICKEELTSLKLNASDNSFITKIDFTTSDGEDIITLSEDMYAIGSLGTAAKTRYLVTIQMNVVKCEEITTE